MKKPAGMTGAEYAVPMYLNAKKIAEASITDDAGLIRINIMIPRESLPDILKENFVERLEIT